MLKKFKTMTGKLALFRQIQYPERKKETSLRCFEIHPLFCRKSFHLCRQFYLVFRSIKLCDGTDSHLSFTHTAPELLHCVSHRCHCSKPGHYHSSFHTVLLFYIAIPPSTFNTCPVIYPALSDARNQTASATSSGFPKLPSGI